MMSSKLLSALGDAALAFARRLSPTSIPTSPPPNTTPAPTPFDPTSMMTMMKEMMENQAKETRRLVMSVLWPQGVSPTTPSDQSALVVEQMEDPWAPYDAMDLSPELKAVAQREAEEDQLQAFLKERAVLQGRMQALQEQERVMMENQDLGSGTPPWVGAPNSTDGTDGPGAVS